jgi:alpha-tubulin suppressor-like RCC1 family protein
VGAYEMATVWFVDGDAAGGDGSSWNNAFDKLEDALAEAKDSNEIWVAAGTYEPTTDTDRNKSFDLVEGAGVYGGFTGTAGPRDWVNYRTTLTGDIGTPDDASDNSYHVVTGANDAVLDGFWISDGNADGSDANRYGAGIYCKNTSPVIRNCVITKNDANMYGGGIYFNDKILASVANCFFIENNAYRGGAIANVGYTWTTDCFPTISNCVLADNTAWLGAGGYNLVSSPTMLNCTFSGNEAGTAGGAILNHIASCPKVTGSIIWANEPDEIKNSFSAPIFRYCDVNDSGGSGAGWDEPNFGIDGGGNIDADPCFVNDSNVIGADSNFGTLDDGLRLLANRPFIPGSPCIDAGDGLLMTLATDIGGYRRRIDEPNTADTGPDDQPSVDMGAYEYFPLRISGGEFHTLLVKADGTGWACGKNAEYQLGTGYSDVTDQTLLVRTHDGNMVSLSGYLDTLVLVDGGFWHSLGLDDRGFVWAWGANPSGQIGDGSDDDRDEPVRPVAGEMSDSSTGYMEDIIQIAAGRSGEYSMGLDASGRVWTWGNNASGQLGNGKSWEDYPLLQWVELSPVRVHGGDQNDWSGDPNLVDVVDIDAGIDHSIACDANADVFCWGMDISGQLGNGAGPADSCDPLRVLGVGGQDYLTGIVDVAVSCGLVDSGSGDYGSSFALDDSGYVFAWGDNSWGQLGNDNKPTVSHTPVEVNTPDAADALDDIVAISAGNYHVLALDANGCVWAWGKNVYGQLGNGESGVNECNDTPVMVHEDANTVLTDIIYIDAGFEHSMAIDKYGTIWVWGRNQKGQLGLGNKGPGTERVHAERMPQK